MLKALAQLISRRARWFALSWAVLVVLGFAAAAGSLGGQGLFDRLAAGDAPQTHTESRVGRAMLTASATAAGPFVSLVLDRVDPQDPATSRALTTALAHARTDELAVGGVAAVLGTFPDAPNRSLFISTDRQAVLLSVQLKPGLTTADEARSRNLVSQRLRTVAMAVPGSVGHVGSIVEITHEINGQVKNDLRFGEIIALPISLLVMIVVFGGLLAAGLPIIAAIASISGALACLLGFSYAMDLDASVVSVVTVLGLGLCIDYGLLLVSRFREELRRSPEPDSAESTKVALQNTMATAGRTVLFSGLTVAISLSGLLLFDAAVLRAVGAAGVSAVMIALLVALTLVPTCLALAGARMIRPGVTHRLPLLNRLARRLGDVAPAEGAFSRLAHLVQRRPIAVVLVVLFLLAGTALPALHLRLLSSGVRLLPPSNDQRQLFVAIDTRFPLAAAPPIQVVSHADAVQLAAWGERMSRLPGVASVDPVSVRGAGADRISVLAVRSSGDAESDQARGVVEALRANRPDFPIWVTGETALVSDFLSSIRSRAPVAIGIVVLATFVLLFLMTGSVLVPLKALLMNVVSLGAAFGVLVWGFQDRHLEGLLGFSGTNGLETSIPSLVLAFGFGLAMDYEVFLLSRIKESRDGGMSNDESVAHGLQRSGRIITSAALIIGIVFAGFAAGRLLVIKELGVALTVAIAIDATLVRMLLVPATMTLLGDWNWWAPGPLRRLHNRFGLPLS